MRLKAQNNKGNAITIETPGTWHKVTTRQFIKLRFEWDGRDLVQLLSILSGKKYHVLNDDKELEVISGLLASLGWVFDEKIAWTKLPMPNALKIDGKKILVPTDLMSQTFGQKVHLAQNMVDPLSYVETSGYRDYTRLMPLAVAIYLQPAHDGGTFNMESAEKLAEKIQDLPIVDVYPIASFFFEKLSGSSRRGASGWLQRLTRRTRNVKWLPVPVTQKGLMAFRI